MSELAELESNDASVRYMEGGGGASGNGGPLRLGEATPPISPPAPVEPAWYKNPTWLTVVGLGIGLAIYVAWSARKGSSGADESADADSAEDDDGRGWTDWD